MPHPQPTRRHTATLLLAAALLPALIACGPAPPTATPLAPATSAPATATLAPTAPAAPATATLAPATATVPPATATLAPATPPTALPPTATAPPPASPTPAAAAPAATQPAASLPPTAAAAQVPTVAVPLTVTVDAGLLTYPPDGGPIVGELIGARATPGACSAAALQQWAGAEFRVALDRPVTVSGQAGRLVLLGAPLLNDQGTPLPDAAAFGQVRWFYAGPDCAAGGAYILPPRTPVTEWPPAAQVAALHGSGGEQIIITSGAGAHRSSINIFSYEPRYGAWRNDGGFDGDGGAGLGTPPGAANPYADGVVVGDRLYDRSQLRRTRYYRWNPATRAYAPTETHLDFTFGPPQPPVYPEQVVLLYYQAIAAQNYRQAYAYLTARMQQQQGSYAQFAAGFATTRRVWVADLQPIVSDPIPAPTALPDGQHAVQVSIVSEDAAPGGQTITKRFAGTWTVVVHNGVPQLDAAAIKQQ